MRFIPEYLRGSDSVKRADATECVVIKLGATKARFRWRAACVTGTMCSEGGQHADSAVGVQQDQSGMPGCTRKLPYALLELDAL